MQEATGVMDNTLNDRTGNDLHIETYEELKNNLINVSTADQLASP